MNHFQVAAIQLAVTDDKANNLNAAVLGITNAAEAGADLVVLPEMFLCPYQTDLFPLYAERSNGPTFNTLSSLAAALKVWLVAGSYPIQDERGQIFNTSFVFNRDGQCVAQHSKVHLFEVNVPGGQVFREADTLTAGVQATTFTTEFGVLGLCICFDFRFPELARRMALDGAQLILVPGAFNQTTGPAHWELLFRSRAVDNQVYTLGCAPARTPGASYQSWGHSILVEPWGTVVQQLDDHPGVLLETIDLDRVAKIRAELPLLSNRRPEIY